jgi:hypothetical protein
MRRGIQGVNMENFLLLGDMTALSPLKSYSNDLKKINIRVKKVMI